MNPFYNTFHLIFGCGNKPKKERKTKRFVSSFAAVCVPLVPGNSSGNAYTLHSRSLPIPVVTPLGGTGQLPSFRSHNFLPCQNYTLDCFSQGSEERRTISSWWTRLWFSAWTKTSWSSWTSITPGFSNKDFQPLVLSSPLLTRTRWCRHGLVLIDIYMYLFIHDIQYIHEIHVHVYIHMYIHTLAYIYSIYIYIHIV